MARRRRWGRAGRGGAVTLSGGELRRQWCERGEDTMGGGGWGGGEGSGGFAGAGSEEYGSSWNGSRLRGRGGLVSGGNQSAARPAAPGRLGQGRPTPRADPRETRTGGGVGGAACGCRLGWTAAVRGPPVPAAQGVPAKTCRIRPRKGGVAVGGTSMWEPGGRAGRGCGRGRRRGVAAAQAGAARLARSRRVSSRATRDPRGSPFPRAGRPALEPASLPSCARPAPPHSSPSPSDLPHLSLLPTAPSLVRPASRVELPRLPRAPPPPLPPRRPRSPLPARRRRRRPPPAELEEPDAGPGDRGATGQAAVSRPAPAP